MVHKHIYIYTNSLDEQSWKILLVENRRSHKKLAMKIQRFYKCRVGI